MTKCQHLSVATLALLGALGLSAGAYAVTPGKTKGQAGVVGDEQPDIGGKEA